MRNEASMRSCRRTGAIVDDILIILMCNLLSTAEKLPARSGRKLSRGSKMAVLHE